MINLLYNEVHINWSDVASIRIMSATSAYGFKTNFFLVWAQTVNNQITALISKLDNSLTLTVSEHVDFDELYEFLSVVGFETLFCLRKTAENFKFPVEQAGYTMKHNPEIGVYINNDMIRNPSPVKLYEILDNCRCEAIQVPPFESFYPDFSHRTRHGTARSMVLSGFTGVALTLETGTSAIITAVAVLPLYRGKGNGSKLVLSLTYELENEGKEVFVCCLESEKSFYDKIGFKELDEFVILKGINNA